MKSIVMDLDHTMALSHWRDDLIGGPGGWDHYHQSSELDHPAPDMVEMVAALSLAGYNIICLTTRPEKWRGLTMEWMIRHNIPVDELLMRPDDDYRNAVIVKVEVLAARFPGEGGPAANVLFAVDDRDDIAAAYHGMGITAMQISVRRNDD